MDTIWNCAIGLDIDLQNDLDNVYFKQSERVFQMLIKLNPILLMSVLFHELDWLLKHIVAWIDYFKKVFGNGNTNEYGWLNKQVDLLFMKRFEQKVKIKKKILKYI